MGLVRLDERFSSTYGKDDSRLLCELSWNSNVHLQSRRVVAKVLDASECAIDGRNRSADAD